MLYASAKADPRMLPREESAKINAEIERLEQLRKECTDGGIRERIEAWIKQRERSWSPANQNPES